MQEQQQITGELYGVARVLTALSAASKDAEKSYPLITVWAHITVMMTIREQHTDCVTMPILTRVSAVGSYSTLRSAVVDLIRWGLVEQANKQSRAFNLRTTEAGEAFNQWYIARVKYYIDNPPIC